MAHSIVISLTSFCLGFLCNFKACKVQILGTPEHAAFCTSSFQGDKSDWCVSRLVS